MIDTHCHLDNISYKDDISEVIINAKKEGIDKILIPGADINDLGRAKALSDLYSNVFFSAGIHPYHIEQYDERVLCDYSKNKKCLSVGECGLDYFRLPTNKNEAIANIKKQKEVFISHIKLAIKLNKPLIVHIRDSKDNFNASNDVKEIIKKYAKRSSDTSDTDNTNNTNKAKLKGVLHCFNAYEGLLELSRYGFYFAIGGILTFKNAKVLQEVIKKIPLDKLLLETDAPYLTPHPFRGTRNEPKYTALVLDKMSEILQIDKQKLDDLTTSNANFLFDFLAFEN